MVCVAVFQYKNYKIVSGAHVIGVESIKFEFSTSPVNLAPVRTDEVSHVYHQGQQHHWITALRLVQSVTKLYVRVYQKKHHISFEEKLSRLRWWLNF